MENSVPENPRYAIHVIMIAGCGHSGIIIPEICRKFYKLKHKLKL